jgi:disulfide bond formation protein DsbB
MTVLDPVLRRWPIFAFLASAAMLAAAHAFQTFGHLAPCHLCLKQREVYWVALAVSAAGSVMLFLHGGTTARRIAGAILAVIFLGGAGIAGFHAGAEWKWWPAPASCASTGAAVNLADLRALMAGASAPPPACDVAPWRLLGLSMAGWNVLVSVALAALSLLSAIRKGKTR